MAIAKLDHYTIRTADLEASRRFYTDVLQLWTGDRPAFNFPGLWLYAGDRESGLPVVHLVGIEQKGEYGTGAVDHIAFMATDWPSMQIRCAAQGVEYEQRISHILGLNQVFLRDPNGIRIELNYPIAEAGSY